MRHENKGCDSEFIHIDSDEADLREKYAACLLNEKWLPNWTIRWTFVV